MKKETSSLELHYLIGEMQFLLGSKVERIYQEGKNMLLQLFVPSKGKAMINAMAPGYFYLCSKKPDIFPQAPGGFCMFLRKHLENTRIRRITQIGFERIVEIEFEGKEKNYLMIIELFSSGNILLCNEDYMIISALETRTWKDRTIRGGVIYKFPKRKYDALKITKEELKNVFLESEKESVVKTLAMDLGLGGIYAEEACLEAGIEKSKKELSKEEITRLHDALKALMHKKIDAYLTDAGEVFPFRLKTSKNEGKGFESLNAAIDFLVTPKAMSAKKDEAKKAHGKKTEKALEIIKKQEKSISDLEKSIFENTRKGELIYEKYATVKEILDSIRKAREKYSWKEIKEKLKGHVVVKDIDEKESKITIEIDDK